MERKLIEEGPWAMEGLFIEGYTGAVSYAPGDELTLHVSTSAKEFEIEIAREGAERPVRPPVPRGQRLLAVDLVTLPMPSQADIAQQMLIEPVESQAWDTEWWRDRIQLAHFKPHNQLSGCEATLQLFAALVNCITG